MNITHFEEMEFTNNSQVQRFNPHVLITGQSGSGKSNLSEFMLCQRVGQQKCIEIGDDVRMEGCLYGIPENNTHLIARMKEFTNNTLEPHATPNELIFFSGRNLEHCQKIPACIKVRSIDSESLSSSDFELMFGENDTTRTALGYINYAHGDMSLVELESFLKQEDLDKEINKMTVYKLLRKISTILRSGIFSEQYERIDFKKTLNDKKTLTTFNTMFLEDDADKALALNLVLKQVLQCKKKGFIKPNVSVYFREASQFVGKYAINEYGFAQKVINEIIRTGRDLGISALMDTQRARDIPVALRRNCGLNILLKSDMQEAQATQEIMSINYAVLLKIPHLERGTGLIISANAYYYPVFFPPTPHYHKRPAMNIMKYLSSVYGVTHTKWAPIIRTNINVFVENEEKMNASVETGKVIL